MSPRSVLAICLDLLVDAAARRWLIALFGAVSLGLLLMGTSLELEVVDGALAATKLFGDVVGSSTMEAADVALRPLIRGASYLVFYGWLILGVLVTADFGPSLLQPGRIEHLLSLPVRRVELLLGTYLGVLVITSAFLFYAAGGVVLILWFKAGILLPRLIASAALAVVVFMAIYGAMLSAALFVRSAAVSAIVGIGIVFLGILAGQRANLAPMFESGWTRTVFDASIRLFPPVSRFGELGADYAAAQAIDAPYLGVHLFGVLLFALATLAIGLFRFEGRDF
ncbi:MAG: ABC transporter permease subunit [Myxococcota bacterium]